MGEFSGKPARRQAPLPALVSWLGRGLARGAAWLGAWLWRVGAPAARRAGVLAIQTIGRASAWLGRWAVRRRAILVAIAARLGWCAALWMLAQGLSVLVGLEPLGTDHEILAPFAIGIGIAVAVVAVTGERHLRRGAIVVGTANVVALLLAWVALSSPSAL